MIANMTRLFVPLSSLPFEWFASGLKRWELRRRRKQFTEKHVVPGRQVELRRGYSNPSQALWGKIVEVKTANSLREFFDCVPFKEVVPTCVTIDEAIGFAAAILSINPEEPNALIGFRLELKQSTSMMSGNENTCEKEQGAIDKLNTELENRPADLFGSQAANETACPRIPLADEFLTMVKLGKKTTTIRKGIRKYEIGRALLTSKCAVVPITISKLVFTTFSTLSDNDARNDGFNGLHDLQIALHRFYPIITGTDEITIIHFEIETQ
jgi:ASC-1-like (ASCH) protein